MNSALFAIEACLDPSPSGEGRVRGAAQDDKTAGRDPNEKHEVERGQAPEKARIAVPRAHVDAPSEEIGERGDNGAASAGVHSVEQLDPSVAGER